MTWQPVDAEVRARIVAGFVPGARRNALAREHGVSGATVTKIAKEEGFEFDRTQTALAVAAAQIDAKALRAEIAAKFLLRADQALEAMDAPHDYMNWNKDGKFDVQTMPSPTPADQRQYTTIAAIAVQRHADLVRMDATPETAASESMVERLWKGLAEAAKRRPVTPESMTPVDGVAEGMSE